jgi:Protein of unknown function (DUF3800)
MVTMLWAYFDESGEHDKSSGHLKNLTLAGGIATCESWAKLSQDWGSALVDEDVDCFHMTDFENYKPPFDWYLDEERTTQDKARHQRFLNKLLDIMTINIYGAVGFNRHAIAAVKELRATYSECFKDGLGHIVKYISRDLGDQYHLVFAHHDEHKEDRREAVVNAANFGNRLLSCSVGYPKHSMPLQVADLIAYEFGRAQRADREERYPFEKLRKGLKYCSLFTSSKDIIPTSESP